MKAENIDILGSVCFECKVSRCRGKVIPVEAGSSEWEVEVTIISLEVYMGMNLESTSFGVECEPTILLSTGTSIVILAMPGFIG